MTDASLPTLPNTLEEIAQEISATQAALVQSLQDELVCAVCGCVFIDPRVLQCQHCFCLRCLYSTVARDRMPQLDVPCAYRCEELTTTKGDIRTLPKNHYITNTCIILRQHLMRRARLLEKKFNLLGESLIEKEGESDVEEAASSFGPADQTAKPVVQNAGICESATAAPVSAAATLLLKKERDLVAELYECEWCSCSSPSCEVCPYCCSRVCAECRGQFSDHQFLCVEPNQPGHRPPEGWLPGTTPSGVAAFSVARGASAAGEDGNEAAPATDAYANGTAPGHDAAFPFFFTPFFVSTLVKECLVKQHHAPLQLSEIDVTNITPVRLAVPEYAVQCQHHTTGFSFDYAVHPTFSMTEGVTVDLTTPHWTEADGKPSSTLSFLANATRLGETVLHDLHKLSKATSDVVLELSSAAHQAYVRRNKGFHMYTVHVWALVRAQCQIAREAFLPHLERSRLLENIMGDLVTYRFQQTMGRAAPPQKHVIRDRCMAFLKTEIQLCRQLDQVMEGIDAACRGIYTLLGRMREAMKELSQPKVHRGEEHKKSRQSRLRFSVQLFHSRAEEDGGEETEVASLPENKHAPRAAQTTRPRTARTGAVGRGQGQSASALSATTTTNNAAGTANQAALDPILAEDTVSESSFRGQVSEHQGTTQALTDSLISILRCFMQARVWEWSMGNTCIRECGLGEEDRRSLLQTEESLQLLTDELLKRIWSFGRLVYILEVQQDEAGPASSLDILMDTETLALLDLGMENPIYEHTEVFEGLKALSQLRNHLLNVSSASVLATRNPDTQQELLTMMSSVLKTTMQHQTTVLRTVTVAESVYERRFAAYLRKRQMSADVGEAPPIGEGTLLAVDVLKALQQRADLQLTHTSSGAPSTRTGTMDGGDEGFLSQRPLRTSYPVVAASQGGDHAVAPSAIAFEHRRNPHTLVADFSRRDTALISCQRYGEALVRAANGQPLDEGRSVFDASSSTAPAAAAAAGVESASTDTQSSVMPGVLHRLPPLPPPPAEERPVSESSPSQPQCGATEGDPDAAAEPTAEQHENTASDARDERDAEAAAAVNELHGASGDIVVASASSPPPPTSSASSSAAPTAERAMNAAVDVASSPATNNEVPVTVPPNPLHEELLFEADCSNCLVETASVVPSLADSDGSRKAAKLFKTTFQLPATTTSVNHRRVTYLPFFRGVCSYKGVTTTFYVDAQTGIVSVNPQQLCTGGRRQFMLELLSSPLFFILFNSTLSIWLHKRYRLDVFYK